MEENRVGNVSEYSRRKQELASNDHVRKPIPKIGSSVLKSSKAGRKKKYTPTKLKNSINKYFEWCEEEDEIPSIKGLMIHLEMYRDVFYKYLSYEGYSEIMEHARLIIMNWAEEDVYNTKGMAAGKLAYMKNVHTWADKIETKNENTNANITLSVEEAKSKIEMLAPKLLELLQSHEVVKQIGKQDVVEAEVIEEKGVENG